MSTADAPLKLKSNLPDDPEQVQLECYVEVTGNDVVVVLVFQSSRMKSTLSLPYMSSMSFVTLLPTFVCCLELEPSSSSTFASASMDKPVVIGMLV